MKKQKSQIDKSKHIKGGIGMNQRKRVWNLLLAGLLLLSACQKSAPAPKEDTAPEKQEEETAQKTFDPSTYTNAMMLEDYDFVWTTLEENCATVGVMETKRPLNQLHE